MKKKSSNKKTVKTIDTGKILFTRFFSMAIAAKTYHYRTKSYASHKTIDMFFEQFIELSDKFLESWQGMYNRRIEFVNLNMKITIITDKNWHSILTKEIQWLDKELPKLEASSDLLNIRDEMVALIKQVEYLLTFK